MRIAACLISMAFAATAAGQSVTVRGVVRDSATRQGVAGAIVTLATSQRILSTRTDEAGTFAFGGVNPDRMTVAVRRIGYAHREWSAAVGVDTSLTLLIVPNAVRLAPVRVGAKGEGVWGVIVRSTDFAPSAGARVFVAGSGAPVTTDSSGEYFVPLKRPGTFMVRVTHSGYAEDVLPIKVKRDEVVESSHVLEESTRPPTPPGLWADFDKRLRWAPTNNSALVTGADLRAIGGTVADGLRASPAFVRTALRLPEPATNLCVFLDGTPRPGTDIDMIRPEEIRAIEIYSDVQKDQLVLELNKMWPPGAPCGSGGGRLSTGSTYRGRGRAAPPSVRWAVIWTR